MHSIFHGSSTFRNKSDEQERKIRNLRAPQRATFTINWSGCRAEFGEGERFR